MRLILTHEQADFDAVASLLAARLLDERALAALPVRVNRNVRSFLALYGADLPFVLWHDVPREPLEAVTLVDTQTLPSVRGLTATTPVRVIDHHPRRADLPARWQVHTEPVGATTTLLLEALQDRLPRLSQLQATLLLLGIYEDTGSLSYEGTTVRDVRAAAFLLEQGASLGIAREFLNPPLTAPQRMVYDILLANADVQVVQGATVAVAHAQVEGLTDDIAPLAHKLRDALETDALFVLVSVPAGVQLVARATGDQVDLPAIVAHFGGGGHRRAAAALVKGRSLEDVRTELWEVLPRYIRPPLTVGEIMSRRPQVLSPDTPVEEADRLMRTFGYEGYPVVEKGRVVGLLTRRAVDRALSHGLRVPVGRLMEAGEVTIRPDDPIDRLQQLMTDTGWGQIPVVDENGSIAGIVTRTDLIKTLAPRPRRPGMHNLAARLESALPLARLALLKAAAAEAERLYKDLASDRVRAIWDPANEVYAADGELPFPDAFERMKPYIIHVHIKDAVKDPEAEGGARCVPVGDGGYIDYPGQFQALIDMGYEGACSLETHWRPSAELDEELLNRPGGAAFSAGGEEASRICFEKILAIIDTLDK